MDSLTRLEALRRVVSQPQDGTPEPEEGTRMNAIQIVGAVILVEALLMLAFACVTGQAPWRWLR